jgi:PadR family transcriptional regulator, regulatory protein PadR
LHGNTAMHSFVLMIDLDNTKAQMRKGILEFCILNIISRGEIYPSDILKELKDAKLLVVEGTLYPLLTRLKNAGILTYAWVESRSGPPRKYYRLTDAGQSALSELTLTWNELQQAVTTTTQPQKS